MKFYLQVFLMSLAAIVFSTTSYSQISRLATNKDQAILVQGKAISGNPAKIIISWKKHDQALNYRIQKKGLNDAYWSADIATLDTTKTSFEDLNVVTGQIYEYKIFANCKGLYRETVGGKDTLILEQYYAYGYLCSGIEANLPPKGKVLLLIDQTIYPPLQNEIEQLKDDLILEGWEVVSKLVPRAEKFNKDAVQQVRMIVDSNTTTSNMYIMLIGRVPVPYSGNFNPDAHPDHRGAWPADVYYGDNGRNFWSDVNINNSSATREENKNIPGDGKFDLIQLSTDVEFPVGRIDFYNMPAFPKSEVELLRQYLSKNHSYRTGGVKASNKCIVDDNFGGYIEGFATSGWRLAPLVGIDNIKDADYLTSLATETHYWSYGTGGGSYTSAGGIGSTPDFTTASVKGIFTMLFGSYFGDWDSQNNFLRAPLASSPSILTCSWAGRPQWYNHHMGIGLPIGVSTIKTINNLSTYISNYLYPLAYPSGVNYSIGQKQVHQALLGDPTLSMYMGDATTAKNLTISQPAGKPVNLFWDRVFDDNLGYNLYKSLSGYNGPYKKVNNEIITDTRYTDTSLFEGEVFYMVKTVKLTETASGSFLNESRGVVKNLVVTSIGDNLEQLVQISCLPNPSKDYLKIQFSLPSRKLIDISICDISGNIVASINNDEIERGNYDFSWDLKNNYGMPVSSGAYLIKFNFGNETIVKQISVIR